MSERKIKITISPMGDPKIEAIGFNGEGCEQATSGIERALSGGKGVERVLKPEWFEQGTNEEGEQNFQW